MRLAVEDIVMRFEGLTALDGVAMHLESGEILGLIGPNGSGKTTLLNIISGVLEPTAGRIGVGERRYRRLTPRRAAMLGIRRTFQNIRLFEDMTALETVEVPAAALGQGDRRRIARAALAQLDFLRHEERIATELPYGLQRRLEIARALAGRVAFLLLDEPAAGMNDVESDALVETIRAIRAREKSGILLIDHDLRVIMNACDRVIVLSEGKLISEGAPQAVRNDPAVIKAYLG